MENGAERLTALDATFLELEEADESAHMHIGAVMVLEPPQGKAKPHLGAVQKEIVARLDRLPRYTQRLSSPRTGGLRWPMWEQDPTFDIAHHVRSAGLPAPGGTEELREWAEEFFSIRLDRHRPLWELVVLELADGRWALASKTHHSLVDGVGSVDAAKVLLDSEPEPAREVRTDSPIPARPTPPAADSGGPLALLSPRGLAGGALQLAGKALGAAGSAVRGTASALETVTDPQRLGDALRQAQAVAELLVKDELVAAPDSSINAPIGAHRRLGVVVIPLATLKEIRGGLGGTVNDVVLAAAAGGLRKLLLARGEEPPSPGLRAMVPVNIRPAAERLALGNQITSLFVHLPVAEPELERRYRLQHEEAEGLKSGRQARGSRGIIDTAALAPPALHSFLARSLFATRLFNVTITNVPGPQQPLYAMGARVEEIWPLVPLAAEHAIGIAVLSYDGAVCFCVNADQDSVPDLEVLRDGIAEEIEALAELAGAAGGGAESRAAATG